MDVNLYILYTITLSSANCSNGHAMRTLTDTLGRSESIINIQTYIRTHMHALFHLK